MEGSFLTQVGLPAVLAFIMFGLGLSLTVDDFVRLRQTPKAVIAGLIGQLLWMPLVALGIALFFDLEPTLAVGMMILAACPGGTTSNIISHVARANLALSITLTAIATLVCVFTTPVLIALSVDYFAKDMATEFSLAGTTLGLMFISLFPVALGLFLRHKFPNAAMRREAFFRHLSSGFMVLMIIAVVIQEWNVLVSSFKEVFWATLFLNLVTIASGVIIGKVVSLSDRDCVTLGIEVGIQNASMAILIAVTFLSQPAFAVSAGVYGLTMYLGAGALLVYARGMRHSTDK